MGRLAYAPRAMKIALGALVAVLVGLAAGVIVTRQAHRKPSSPGWALRVGNTRLRRCDLPLGGSLALLAALVLAVAGHPGLAIVVAALGIGAAVGAVGTGLTDPLPPPGDQR
jgi:hypothetical protein